MKKNGAKKSKERGEEKGRDLLSRRSLLFFAPFFYARSGLSLALLYAPGSLRMGVVNPIDTDFRHQSIEIDKGKSCDFDTIDFAIEIDNN